MVNRLFIGFVLLLYVTPVSANKCLGWFLKSGLTPKEDDCELKCAITPVDMGTFSCTSECSEFCSKSLADQVIEYVPRLTEGDKIVVSKMPTTAYKAFLEKEKATKLTSQIFQSPGRQDESDAFRHFVWSVLLAKELGVEKAQIVLDGHENDSTQSKSEKEMDLSNNKEGLDFFKKATKSGKTLDLSDIEKEALYLLREKKLSVLKPRYEKIPSGYYSK